MKITSTNYFEASAGVFKVIPSKWAEKCLKSVKLETTVTGTRFGKIRTIVRMKPVVLGNHRWIPNFGSYSDYWGNLSVYWVSEDGTHLLRVSDHWSLAQRGVRQCGNIRCCWWELSGRRQPGVETRIDGLYRPRLYWGGTVAFDEMTPR